MDLKEKLALFLLDEQQARRKRLLENVVNGKKTVATLYWSLRYDLLGYFGVGRYFGIYNLSYDELLDQNLIKVMPNNSFVITNKGQKEKNQLKIVLPDNKWEKQFQNIDITHFKQRFMLFIQVVSEYSHGEDQYYALNINQKDKRFVKNYFKSLNKTDLEQRVKSELINFLSELDNKTALLFALELVGYHNNGNTMEQIAQKLKLDSFSVYFVDLSLFCLFTKYIEKNPASIFKPLLNGLSKSFLNQSALKTFKLYEKTHNINTIIKQRKIKSSTIYEHLLEIAICWPINKFPYADFITSQDKELLVNELGPKIDTWNYEDLPGNIKRKLSFFKFRLIEILLTKRNLVNANGEIEIDEN